MRPDTITLAIEEKYKPEELAEIAKNMALAIAEVETITGEKKVSDAAFNERLKKADAQVTTLARSYNKGTEVAQIGCDICYDVPEVGMKSYIRMDTGETVAVHEMNWEEKQETIQFPLTPSEPSPELVADMLANLVTALPVEEPPADLPVERSACPHPGCTAYEFHEGDHVIKAAPPEPAPPRKRRTKKGSSPPPPPDNAQPGAQPA
jgi:hypothetical protein